MKEWELAMGKNLDKLRMKQFPFQNSSKKYVTVAGNYGKIYVLMFASVTSKGLLLRGLLSQTL